MLFSFQPSELSSARSAVPHLRASLPSPGTGRRRVPGERASHVTRAGAGAGSRRREGACARPAVNKHCACAAGQGFCLLFCIEGKKGAGVGPPDKPSRAKTTGSLAFVLYSVSEVPAPRPWEGRRPGAASDGAEAERKKRLFFFQKERWWAVPTTPHKNLLGAGRSANNARSWCQDVTPLTPPLLRVLCACVWLFGAQTGFKTSCLVAGGRIRPLRNVCQRSSPQRHVFRDFRSQSHLSANSSPLFWSYVGHAFRRGFRESNSQSGSGRARHGFKIKC